MLEFAPHSTVMIHHHTEGNLNLAKIAGNFTNAELLQSQRTAVDVSWAPEEVKLQLRSELQTYSDANL